MTFSLRHISLLTGIFIIIISFLWFGRDTNTYDLLLLTGLIIAGISYLIVLFKKDSLKSKLLWTLVVILSIGLQWLTEPPLTRLSYRIFINQHDTDLTSVTSLLSSKNNSLFLSPSSELWTRHGFTQQEANQVKERLKNTGISFVTKDSAKIFYRTWGMLDVSHGIYYFYSDTKPDSRYRQIFGNWYY